MITGQQVKLEFLGKEGRYKFIGAGATTYAYRGNNELSEVLLVVPDLKFKDGTSMEDTTKDTLCKAYAANKINPYLPQIRFVAHTFVAGPELNTACKIYVMPFYRGIKKNDKQQWLDAKRLQKVRDDSYHAIYKSYSKRTGKRPSMTFLGNESAYAACCVAKEKLNVFMYSAMKTLFDCIDKNHIGVTFEFNKRNLGIDGITGHLVFRDPVYDSELTTKIKQERRDNEK
jgi:hypothetical protein